VQVWLYVNEKNLRFPILSRSHEEMQSDALRVFSFGFALQCLGLGEGAHRVKGGSTIPSCTFQLSPHPEFVTEMLAQPLDMSVCPPCAK